MVKRLMRQIVQVDETVIRVIPVSWFHYRWAIVRNTLLLIAAFFFLYPLQTLGAWGIYLCVLVMLIALAGFARIGIIRSCNVCILTNKRIIDVDQAGLFERDVSECPLDHIQDIRYNVRGIMSTIFHVGTVILEMGGRGRIELQDIGYPAKIKDVIINTQKYHTKKSRTQQIQEEHEDHL